MKLSEKMICRLKELASSRVLSNDDNFSAYNCSGGNFNNAFDIGVSDGERSLARDILTDIGIEYTIED